MLEYYYFYVQYSARKNNKKLNFGDGQHIKSYPVGFFLSKLTEQN